MTFTPSWYFKASTTIGIIITAYIALVGPTEVSVIPFALGGIAIGIALVDLMTIR